MRGVRFFCSYPFKLGATLACLIVLATGTSSFLLYQESKPLILAQMGSRLEDMGRAGTLLFGPEEFSAIEKVRVAIISAQKSEGVIVPPAAPGDYRKTLPDATAEKITKLPEYRRIYQLLRRIKEASRSDHLPVMGSPAPAVGAPGGPTLAYVSLFMADPTDPDAKVAQWLVDSDYDDPKVPAPPGNLLFNNSSALTEAFKGRVAADPDFRVEQGMDILTAAIPLLDASGTRRAILSLYYDAKGEVNYVNRLYYLCWFVVLGALGASILCAAFLSWFLTRDLRALIDTAERVRDRDFSATLDLKRSDELGMLATTFNAMIQEIRQYSLGLEATNTAYARFVPRQILEYLGQDSITNIRSGDQVQRQMTVLFADIRSFTTISESMSPRDNFDFINEYLRTIGPIIRKHRGFIDKYIGDAIMALFPDRAADAVAAAIEMHATLESFNIQGKEVGRPPVRIGIGIHRGSLMLGTVGEEERMEGTVISDAVNLASRLQGLTKQFGAGIIVSDAIIEAQEGGKPMEQRYLGEANVKGKRRSVKIFEVFENSDGGMSAKKKAVNAPEFERAVKAFERGDYLKARRLFNAVLKGNREDIAAKYYLAKCRSETKARTVKVENVIEVDEERFQKKG